MKKIDLVAIDIDGTLLSNQQTVPENNIKAIRKAVAEGKKVVIASGRPLSGILPWLNIIGVPISDDQFVIAFNGALIQTTSGKIIAKNPVTYQDYLEIQKFADNRQAYFQIESTDGSHTIDRFVPNEAQMENYLVNSPLFIHDKMPEEVELIKPIINGSKRKLDSLQQILPLDIKTNLDVVRGAWYNLEFMSKQATKGSGLQKISEFLNIDLNSSMAIGDQGNDLSMFEKSGISVAMGNASKDIQNKADFVTKKNNEAGVGYAISKFVI